MTWIKYFIDYGDRKREGGNCRKIKSFDDFSMNSKGVPRTHCKKCRNEITINRQREARAEMNSKNYKMCNNCDYIFYKYIESSRSFYHSNIRTVVDKCKKCGSKDIEDF